MSDEFLEYIKEIQSTGQSQITEEPSTSSILICECKGFASQSSFVDFEDIQFNNEIENDD